MVLPEVRLPAPTAGDRWRWEDLASTPEDGLRYEVVEGALVVDPSPRLRHQEVVGDVYTALRAAAPPHLLVLPGPVDVVLPDGDVLVPDVLVVRRDDLPARAALRPPALVVEVLSPSRRFHDLVTKREMYARCGVPHYWVVDPDAPGLLAVELGTDAETSYDGPGPHRLARPFPVEVSLR